MNGDVWQVERYNLRKRTWEPFGRPSTDFASQYKKVSALQACGSKARLAKVTAKPAAAVETPEQKLPAGETPEDKARRLGCTFSAPFNCEYCNRKSCPITVDNIRRAQEEANDTVHRALAYLAGEKKRMEE